jgi:hypothetical protein
MEWRNTKINNKTSYMEELQKIHPLRSNTWISIIKAKLLINSNMIKNE